MKKILIAAVVTLALVSCTKSKEEVKAPEVTYQVRLEVIDIDGKIHYSNIQTVNL